MRPLGVLKRKVSQSVLLDLPFTADILDTSENLTPLSVVTGTPSFTTGAMQLTGGARVRTGATDNTPISSLNLYNKLYTIEFDIKMQLAGYPTVVLYRGSADSTNVQTIIIDSVANTISVSNHNNLGIFSTYNLGFDSKAVFFNVKLVRTSLNSYALFINNTLVRSVSSYSLGVLDDNSNNSVYHGFRFGQAAVRPFFIKNFKVSEV